MTVDVEDYFQVSAFERHIAREDWDRMPCRVERNMDRILDLFDGRGVKATFFVLGWMAERYPGMVRR
ncbi:polysaccharide deacetylase family protein, partial [Thioalkalivibrio denitrificans]|uniref:polysaccharide deacetylase family protein n=1 Tax=Thioalkalivibrio denitrificans TaxID=108003 RepID=UPI001FE36536